MIGFGPKRVARGFPQQEPVPKPEDLDDIFAPEAAADAQVRRAPVQHGAQAQNNGPVNPATHVRTRLILRRALVRQARAERNSRNAAPAPAPARPSAKPSISKKRVAPAHASKPERKPIRKPKGLQLGIVAAVAGVICGTALAYIASDYFSGELSAQNVDANTSQPAAGEIEPAAASLPEEVAQARASTESSAGSTEDKAPGPDVEEASYEEPLPLPSEPPQDEEGADAANSAPEEPAPLPPESQAAEPQQPPSVTPEEPAQVAAVDPATSTQPARDTLVPGPLETFRDCELCPAMVKLPPAEFTMGSPESEDGHQSNEAPQRVVAFRRPFAIGQFEITISDWDACVQDGGCKLKIKDEGWGRDNRPAINVSWEDITTQYLPWLSKKTGQKYRLPSESEWEYAARARMGTDSLAPRFSFGNDANELCGFGNGADATAKEQNGGGTGADCRDGYAATAPAGSFKPNPFGLFDMHGNVWEWVEDCWNEGYEKAPADGKAWTEGDCTSRVVRGGSWNSDIPKLRSATRGWNQPSGRNRSIGFRVVREL